MYMSKLVGKTLKKYENEFKLEGQELLFRTGMFREVGPGAFAALPFGVRIIEKTTEYLTQNLHDIGFQRMYTVVYDFQKNMSLAVRNDIKSYKELPAYLYDIQRIERNEIRVRDGLLKSKEYKVIRGCSFHEDNESIVLDYDKFKKIYIDLFNGLGIEVLPLEDYFTDGATKNGHSFVVKEDKGNRTIYSCEACDYNQLEEAANFNNKDIEKGFMENTSPEKHEEIYTPNIKTINELQEFLGVEAKDLAKTLLIKVENEIIAVVLRGDRELNKHKLSKALGISVDDIEMANENDIGDLGTVAGFVGPVGLEKIKIIVDREVSVQGSFITGANKKDYHIKNVWISRDVQYSTIADVSYIKEDDRCPKCGGSLKKENGIDIAGICNEGKIEGINNFNYKDKEGKTKDILGCYYYIDIYKLLSVIVEAFHDEEGMLWPYKIAPYHVIVSILNTKFQDKVELGEKIYKELTDANISAILDERNIGVGAKFKDADLLGIPIRITIGKKADEKIVEFKLRSSKEKEELKVNEALGKTMKILKGEGLI